MINLLLRIDYPSLRSSLDSFIYIKQPDMDKTTDEFPIRKYTFQIFILKKSQTPPSF